MMLDDDEVPRPPERVPVGVTPRTSSGYDRALDSIGRIQPGSHHISRFDVVPKHETLSTENGVRFNVETVPDPLKEHLEKPLIPAQKLIEAIQESLATENRLDDDFDEDGARRPIDLSVIKTEAMSPPTEAKKLVHVSPRGWVMAVVTAFAQHLPLVLSPDHIWIAISYAFAKHVDLNAEALRKNFVQHDGKKRLLVVTPDGFPMSHGRDPFGATKLWETHVFPDFSKQIKESIGDRTHDVIAASFSTTTSAIKAAHEITLMSAMKNYFSFGMRTMCGIPHVTLLGTEADWVNLRARAESLGHLMTPEFSGQWMPLLLPVLDQFVESYRGQVNHGFWQSMVKLRRTSMGSGGYSFVSGWMQILFPYLASGELSRRLRPWNEAYFSGPELDQFPPLVSSAPVDWNYYGTVFDLDFHAGVLGFEQDPSDGALSPLLGWYVSHTPPKPAPVQLQEFKKELEDLVLGHMEEAVEVPVNTEATWYQRALYLRNQIQRLEGKGDGNPEL